MNKVVENNKSFLLGFATSLPKNPKQTVVDKIFGGSSLLGAKHRAIRKIRNVRKGTPNAPKNIGRNALKVVVPKTNESNK